MITDYDEFKRLLKESFPNTSEGSDGVLFLTMDSINISIVPLPGDPGAVMFRLRVLDLKDIGRPGEFAKAALKGNFFWSGTNGATLSVGNDNALYLTERRYLGEFVNTQSIESCLNEFAYSVNDWRMRGQTYA
jgi:hypothetical protein